MGRGIGLMLNDLNLERQLLGLLMQDKEALSTVLGGKLVLAEYFSDMTLRRIFIALSKLYMENFELPTKRILRIALGEKRKKVDKDLHKILVEKLFKIKADRVRDNLTSVLEHLRNYYKGRMIQKSVKRIASEFDRNDIPKAVEIYNRTRDALELLTNEEVDEGDYVDDFEARRDFVKQKRDHPELFGAVPCKIPIYRGKLPYASKLSFLEDVLGGGWYNHRLSLVVGHSNTGKSTFLMESAFQAAWEGRTTALFTIEMAKQEQQYRVDSRLSKIEVEKFQKGTLTDKEIEKWKRQIQRFKAKAGQIRVIGYPQGCTPQMIESKLHELRKKLGKIDLVCIDYLNDMKPSNVHSKKDWSGIGEISLDLRNMTRYFNNHEGLKIITANQGKKGTRTQKILSEGSVAFSPLPHQHADLVLMIKEELDTEGQIKYLSMKVDKNRFGPKGEIFFMIPDFNVARIATQIKWDEGF